MRRVLSARQRLWVISTVLIALLVRALIPAGFMPATDRPFSFQVCPDGFPAALLKDFVDGGNGGAPAHGVHHHDGAALAQADHHHGDDGQVAHAGHHHNIDGLLTVAHHHEGSGHNHSSASGEHCVFAAAAGAFALAFSPAFSAPAASVGAPDVAYASPLFESRRFRIPQPRGPPPLS